MYVGDIVYFKDTTNNAIVKAIIKSLGEYHVKGGNIVDTARLDFISITDINSGDVCNYCGECEKQLSLLRFSPSELQEE